MNHKDYINAAQRITKSLEGHILDSVFADNGPSRLAGSLTLTILELQNAVLLVVNSFSQTHAPILVRSMLETFINLKCLNDYVHFINQIHHDDAKQNTMILEEVLKTLDEKEDVYKEAAKKLAEEQNTLKTHRANGIKKMTLYDKFKLAGQIQQYGKYCFMCTFSHSNASTIYARHGVGKELNFSMEFPLPTLTMTLRTGLDVYLYAIRLLPNYSSAKPEDIEKSIAAIKDDLAYFDLA